MTTEDLSYNRGRVDGELASLRKEQDRLANEAREARKDGRAELQQAEQRLLQRIEELQRGQHESEQRLAVRIHESETRQGARVEDLARDVRAGREVTDTIRAELLRLPDLLSDLRAQLKEDAQAAAKTVLDRQKEEIKPGVTQHVIRVIYILLGLLALGLYGVEGFSSVFGAAP